ncbi:MAG: class I poly(R)-hydroxyalkanoic acid synthase [Pseudomonadota bacterium]
MSINDATPPEITADQHGPMDRLINSATKVDALLGRLSRAMIGRKMHDPRVEAPDPSLFQKAAMAYWAHAMHHPFDALRQQAEFWGSTALNMADTSVHAMTMKGHAHDASDARFANAAWDANPYLHMILQQYRINADALSDAVASADNLDTKERQKLAYFAEQIVNLSAPNNFLPTNPDAFERAIETEGQSLIQGLENLVEDLEASDGDLLVRLADEAAFKVGDNIATTPGDVVYRNHMMELIQYAPATDEVHETPIVLFPPWINKFYILDLKEKNSLIKWITEQGYTLFVASWINPDETYADTGLEDYIEDGYLTAIREAKAICSVKQVNAVGYCIAGTTLSLTLALLKRRGDRSVKSATFFTTLTDFSDQGEFTPFLQDDFIDGIEGEVDRAGILDARILARTFSFLRSKDLVYGPAIRNYMLGETPPAFDLLYWNGDSTNLPGKMAMQYLRGICQGNGFAEGTIELLGETLNLRDVDIPLMAIACETDHIAAWKDCYRGVQKMGSAKKTFVVSESGHIAGIVNPSSKKKYGHYTNPDWNAAPDDWLEKADYTEGSWWPTWNAWLKPQSGKLVPARVPGDAYNPSLGPAPGQYVTVKA